MKKERNEMTDEQGSKERVRLRKGGRHKGERKERRKGVKTERSKG